MHLHRFRILVIDPISNNTLEGIREMDEVEEVHYDKYLDESSILELLPNYEVLVLRSGYTITHEWLEKAINLKCVIRAGVGTDNIPQQLLQEMRIKFYNIPHATTTSVAEYVVGSILIQLRNLIPAHLSIQKGEWKKAEFIGNELSGKSIGLIGYGRIGQEIDRLLSPFNVNVLYYSRTKKRNVAHARYGTLEEIAKKCEVISVQVPLTRETYNLLDENFFSSIKNPVTLINVARYNVINMKYLKKALINGKVRSCLIDPFERGYDISPYDELPIYFLPHLGGNTFEAQDRIGEEIKSIIRELTYK